MTKIPSPPRRHGRLRRGAATTPRRRLASEEKGASDGKTVFCEEQARREGAQGRPGRAAGPGAAPRDRHGSRPGVGGRGAPDPGGLGSHRGVGGGARQRHRGGPRRHRDRHRRGRCAGLLGRARHVPGGARPGRCGRSRPPARDLRGSGTARRRRHRAGGRTVDLVAHLRRNGQAGRLPVRHRRAGWVCRRAARLLRHRRDGPRRRSAAAHGARPGAQRRRPPGGGRVHRLRRDHLRRHRLLGRHGGPLQLPRVVGPWGRDLLHLHRDVHRLRRRPCVRHALRRGPGRLHPRRRLPAHVRRDVDELRLRRRAGDPEEVG